MATFDSKLRGAVNTSLRLSFSVDRLLSLFPGNANGRMEIVICHPLTRTGFVRTDHAVGALKPEIIYTVGSMAGACAFHIRHVIMTHFKI